MPSGVVYRAFTDDEDYVGSSNNFEKRHRGRMVDFINKKNKGKPTAKSLNYFDEVGYENVNVEILEEIEYDDPRELLWAERNWIERLRPSLNTMLRPIITEEERIARNRWWNNKRRENPEFVAYMKTYLKKYQQENKEKLARKQKEYREKNADKIKQQRSTNEYKEHKNELRRNTSWRCDVCDCEIKGDKSAFNRHLKSKKHLSYVL